MNRLRIAAITVIVLMMGITCDSLRPKDKGWLEVQVHWEDVTAQAEVDTIRVTATPGNWILEQALSDREAVFPELEPGTYTVFVEALDANSVVLCSGTTLSVTIQAGQVEKVEVTLRSHRPVLEPLSSPDDDGTYTVRWSLSERATGYVLEEGNTVSFEGSQVAHIGSEREKTLTDKPDGTYWYRVKGTNAQGDGPWSAATSVRVLWPDTTAPELVWEMPLSGSEVHETVMIRVSASDNRDVAYVTFYVDGTSVGTVSTPPFEISWDTRGVSEGVHRLFAQAADSSGNVGDSEEVSVTVVNLPSPLALDEVPSPDDDGAYTLSWSASERAASYVLEEASDSTFTGLRVVYSGAERSWEAAGKPSGWYYYRVKGTNATGDGPYSPWMGVRVHLPDAEDPTVSLLSPEAGSTLFGTVEVRADASDDVGVVKVAFFLNGEQQSEDTEAPFVWTWDTRLVQDNSYTLYAKAWDGAGKTGTSEIISIIVENGGGNININVPWSDWDE